MWEPVTGGDVEMQNHNLIDVLSETGLRTGEILTRAEVHRLGKRHRTVHLYLFNARHELLLQKRALGVDNFPGFFTISTAGHVDAGEFSAASVRRETEEELGIDASKLKFDFLFSHYREVTLSETYIDRQFNDVYMTRADIDLNVIRFDPAEVSEVRFVTFGEFRSMTLDTSSGLVPGLAAECRDLVYFLGDSFA
jgi:isopentenyl-diphosphate delta-isomerase